MSFIFSFLKPKNKMEQIREQKAGFECFLKSNFPLVSHILHFDKETCNYEDKNIHAMFVGWCGSKGIL